MALLLIISDVVSAVCYLLFLTAESCGRRTSTSPSSPCRLSSNNVMFQYEYYQEGDITIGGIFSVNSFTGGLQSYEVFHPRLLCTIPNVKNYADLMTFIFAVDEINNESDLLPNITLGYHLYDTCGDSIQSVQNVLSIMTGQQLEVPNYSCRKHGEVAAFIGDTFSMAQLLGIYGYSKWGWDPTIRIGSSNLKELAALRHVIQQTLSQVTGKDMIMMSDNRAMVVYLTHAGETKSKSLMEEAGRISYEDVDPLTRNSDLYRTFFTTTKHDDFRYKIITLIVTNYNWDWVGILTPVDNTGEAEAEKLRKHLNMFGVCVAFIIQLSSDWFSNSKKLNMIQKSNARVIIICGKFYLHYSFLKDLKFLRENITFILHESWSSAFHLGDQFLQAINCSLIVSQREQEIPGLESFLHSIAVTNRPNDPILEDILYYYFACFIPNKHKYLVFQSLYEIVQNCSGGRYPITSALARSKYPTFYHVYTAVYILAHALREMMISTGRIYDGSRTNGFKGKLQRFLRKVSYIDHTGQNISFNKDGELSFPMSLYNWIFNTEASGNTFESLTIGHIQFEDKASLSVRNTGIQWKTGKIKAGVFYGPQIQTVIRNDEFAKKINKEEKAAWQSFVAVTKNFLGNKKAENYELLVQRMLLAFISFPKLLELSHNLNVLKRVLLDTGKLTQDISNSAATTAPSVLQEKYPMLQTVNIATSVQTMNGQMRRKTFISFWDTPLVKANNRIVSFTLLVSILLSFFCVFLFLGRPVDVTCLLRQISFGFFFSVSVSSVLAKTIMVCIVFRATRPGSSWKKWMEAKYSYYVIVTCSSIQVLICVSWLLVSPPHQDVDLYSYLGKIIIQCNEGSVIAFYSMLGYLGFLAFVSFVLAFMVRTLPDSFNEAKYITFSMLVFCSVWIAMIPAYLSTKGKYMVAVEIFAILTSCAGILVCIFFPKCYILILKPELNCRKQLVEKLNY
ncbi:vomeronasal type-2 receptor 26-like [Anomaloglossus baeobatrachus]|uniref:vomeronasal type-2 receptor 26-like n=1 Tax=Anomaloglossus baeobatrachus TaxID=238106 RepID=UPI003F4FB976